MSHNRWLAVAAVLSSLVGMAGCGGSGGAGSAVPVRPARPLSQSALTVRVEWPKAKPDAMSRLVPLASESLNLRLTRDGQTLATAVINKPNTVATLTGIKPGDVTVRADACSLAGGQGIVLASAEQAVLLRPGQTATVPLSLASRIARYVIEPGPLDMVVGNNSRLTAFAVDSANRLLPTPTPQWRVAAGGSVLSLVASRAVAEHSRQFKASAVGTATVEAKVEEAPGVWQTATAEVRVGEVDPKSMVGDIISGGDYAFCPYAAGRVLIVPLFVEGDGRSDPNPRTWTADGLRMAREKVTLAAQFWQTKAPASASVKAVVEPELFGRVLAVSQDPGNHWPPAEYAWQTEALDQVGGAAGPSISAKAKLAAEALRAKHQADVVAFCYMVPGSLAEAHWGGHGMAWIHEASNYLNVAHELGHAFGAGHCHSGDGEGLGPWGFLGIKAERLGLPCVMSYTNRAAEVCWQPALGQGSRGQVGWLDSDGDGLIDLVDNTPTIEPLSATTGVADDYLRHWNDPGWKVQLRGGIRSVLSRESGKGWVAAQPVDGSFDSAREEFRISGSPGAVIDAKAVNRAGNESDLLRFLSPWWSVSGSVSERQSLGVSADSRIVAEGSTASLNRKVRLYSADTGAAMNGEGVTGICVAFHPAGSLYATGFDGFVGLFDINTHQSVRTIKTAGGWVEGIAFSPDGRLLVAGADPNLSEVFNTQTWQRVCVLAGAKSRVNCPLFTPDSRHVAARDWAGGVTVWDARTGAIIKSFPEPWATSIGIGGSGALYIACHHEIRCQAPNTYADAGTIAMPWDWTAVAASADNKWVAVSSGPQGHIELRPPSGGPAQAGFVLGGWVDWLAFAPDGRSLYSMVDAGPLVRIPVPADYVSAPPSARRAVR